ncbi:gamma-aminobutyrate transaminase POP2 [Cucumis melo var. makuwa]|uniref:Gamma-aminobutyrate transaminase POP2 n=1 Tax=Cucumis melo var. makuwa TaxID=1194695 RepID=A0A5A7TQ17_CUCMM|nr:gamma-aminobutyrate transaminase POP2 [Cucumis melo var. makuwa]
MSLLLPDPRSPSREINVYLQPLIEELKELWTFEGRVQRGIRHILYAWVIDRRSGYEVEYPSWNIDAIFQRTTCGIEVDYTMESWMYTIERSLRTYTIERSLSTLKQYVRNKAHVERSIAEAYVMNELSTFCPRYLSGKEKPLPLVHTEQCRRNIEVLQVCIPHLRDSIGTMSSFPHNNFLETDVMFLKFAGDLDNLAGGSSSVGENSESSSQPSATLTPKRHTQSRLLELECYVTGNGRIPMMIAPNAEKEYIKVVKADLQRFFVLDFNDQAMNTSVEYQTPNTFKEYWGDCHKQFKKYSDSEEARANPPNLFVGRNEDWHFLYDHYMSHAFQHELVEQRAESVDRGSCSNKYTFELRRSCRKPQKMHITLVPSLPQRVVTHPLGMRYAIRCWINGRDTQKALVEDPS